MVLKNVKRNGRVRIEEVIQLVDRGRLVAIVRGDYRGAEGEIVRILADAGVSAVEVTLNSPGAIDSIRTMVAAAADHIAVGAGTVLRPDEVRAAAEAGASFIVSPNRDAGVIRETKRSGLASFPGCLTPSEIVEALDAGADAIKLFPARALDPALIGDLRGPFGDIRFVPTGGIDPTRTRAFIAAGAWAVGIGSALVGGDLLTPGGLDRLAARAAAFVTAARVADG